MVGVLISGQRCQEYRSGVDRIDYPFNRSSGTLLETQEWPRGRAGLGIFGASAL